MRFQVCALTTGNLSANRYCASFARAVAVATIIALGGCAQSTQYPPANAQVAQAAIDVEDDGLPAQTPPSKSIRNQTDDPSQPYSPNYGGVNPSAAAINEPDEQPADHATDPSPKIPVDLPPAFRRQLVTALSEDDATNE